MKGTIVEANAIGIAPPNGKKIRSIIISGDENMVIYFRDDEVFVATESELLSGYKVIEEIEIPDGWAEIILNFIKAKRAINRLKYVFKSYLSSKSAG